MWAPSEDVDGAVLWRYVGPMEESEWIRSAYDDVAISYAELVQNTDPEANLNLMMVQELVKSLPSSAQVLDAGCGAGRMITYLDSLAPLVIEGCDISPSMIELARQSHPDRRFVVADLRSLPFDDASFDGVLAWYSITHTPSSRLPELLAELHRVLRPNGVILLGFQAGDGLRTITGAYGKDVELTAYLHSVSGVVRVLDRVGYHVLANLERALRPGERHSQGFVLAQSRPAH